MNLIHQRDESFLYMYGWFWEYVHLMLVVNRGFISYYYTSFRLLSMP